MSRAFSFFILAVMLCQIAKISPKTSELICVVSFHRHGARTSQAFKSKALASLFGNEMILTANGFHQHEMLGQYLRDKFIVKENLLPETYSPSLFKIYSTPVQRTINSAIGFMKGFFPNSVIKMQYQNISSLDIINNDTIPFEKPYSDYQEIPIEVLSKSNDYFHRSDCDYKGTKLKDKIKEESKGKNIFNIKQMNLTDISLKLAEFLNINIPEDSDDIENGKYLTDLEQYLQSYLSHRQKTLDDPKLSKEISKLIKMKMINAKYSYRIADSKYLRMTTSEIFQSILNAFYNSIVSDDYVRLTVNVAQDDTLINILTNLIDNGKMREKVIKALSDKEMFDFVFPPYASSLMFELYKRNNKYYVKINYNGNYISRDLKYVDNSKIGNNEINYNDFTFMLRELIANDYKKLICDGKYIDKDYEAKSKPYAPRGEKKKDSRRHFMRREKIN